MRLRAMSVQLDEEFEAARRTLALPQQSLGLDRRSTYSRATVSPQEARPSILVVEEDHDESKLPRAARTKSKQGIPLDTLLTKWATERKPALRTIGQMRKVIGRFGQHIGPVFIEDLSRRHIVQFKDELLGSGQTPTNTDKQLVLLSTLLNFALLNSLVEHNAAKGINVGERKNAKAARLPFDLQALRALFASPVYVDGLRPGAGAGEASYWLPILALFTGARLEELCQLRPDDVFEESYFDENGTECKTWVLRITDEGEGQALKTESSRRRFPLHSELVRLGFVQFASEARGRRRIFDELKPDTMGDESGNWSKWFGKYLRKTVGITDKRIVFHSFRHKFKDVARECEIPEDVSDAVTGHSNGNVARRYGGLTYPLRPLVESMHRYRILGLAIPTPP